VVEQQSGMGDLNLLAAAALAEPFALREYAHQHISHDDGVRRDFAETVYWHPVLVLPGDKAVSVQFDLSEAVTQFQVQVWGHSLDGRLGATTKDVAARLPFTVDAKLPVEISSTDKIDIPVALANETDKHRAVKLTVESDNLKFTDPFDQAVPLAPQQRARKLLHVEPGV